MSGFQMSAVELWVAAAVTLSILILFGIVAWQNHVENKDRMESGPSVQERLEALNRHRGGK